MSKTSWSPVAKWYGDIVGEGGHYYHQHVILPRLKQLLVPHAGESVLDVGCGQGVYARALPQRVFYTGIDASSALITQAKKLDESKDHAFFVADATRGLPVPSASYDHAVAILSLQNMQDAQGAITHIAQALKAGGDFCIVLNHPAFRIPRQSSWGKDEGNKVEYRRLNRYLTPLEIPINAHPGDKSSPLTWSYHQPLEYYVKALRTAGMVIANLEEWTSDKISHGKAAKAENRARAEFPLFLALRAVKIAI